MQNLLKKFRKNWILIAISIILILGIILRFYRFTEIPVSMYWDEAALGYNAYTISETGKDEYGTSFPLMFRSFDDYKASGYIYLTAIFVKIFGLSEFSIRFGSALLGSLSILLVFFLTRDLLNFNFASNEGKKSKGNHMFPASLLRYGKYIPLVTALLFAISPWHLQFSRTGFEANGAHFLILLGAVLFFRFINTQKRFYLILASIAFGISFYFYRSILVFAPPFLLGLSVIYFRYIFTKNNIVVLLASSVIFFSISMPMIMTLQTPEGSIRANQVSIALEFKNKEFENAKKINSPDSNLLTRAFYNRRFTPLHVFFANYIKYFDPRYIFLNGDGNLRHGVGGMGVMYLWTAPFILLGLLQAVRLRKEIRNTIFLWILVAPVPAAMSLPSPHNLRSFNVLPMYELLTVLGIFLVLSQVPKKAKTIFITVLFLVATYFFATYLTKYYGEYSRISSLDWADGYRQLAEYTIPREDKYEKIIISGHYWKPYVYFLFYKKYPPEKFQGIGSSYGFDKYIFGGTSWVYGDKELSFVKLRDVAGEDDILVAVSPQEFKHQEINLRVLKEIKNHNGDIVFYVAEIR